MGHLSGSGYGDGSGSGYGDGSGSGSGIGIGYGDGIGYGYGSGYGSGSGSGYGDGIGSANYWKGLLTTFATRWSPQIRERYEEVKDKAVIAYWRSTPSGRSANGGNMSVEARPGLVQEVSGPLELCGAGALHATLNPPAWEGERIWVVALFGEVQEQADKLGALKREIIGECLFDTPSD